MLFIIEAVALGMILKYGRLGKGLNTAIYNRNAGGGRGIGLCFPIYITRPTWHIIIFIYVLIASVAPVWSLLQPRDYLNSYLLVFMIVAAIAGVFISNPSCNLNSFNGFNVDGQYMFPILLLQLPAERCRDSTLWYPPVPRPSRLKMRKICSRCPSAPC